MQAETLIFAAAALGAPQAVRTLVRAKADVNGRNSRARTPFQPIVFILVCLCYTKSYIDIDYNVQGVTPIFVATLNGEAETVKALVQLKADINECNLKAIDFEMRHVCHFVLD